MRFIKEKNRVYVLDENNNMLAFVTFPDIDTTTVNINHTFVSEELRGQNIASKLMEEAYSIIKHNNKRAILECSYAQKWFLKHKEYNDILK